MTLIKKDYSRWFFILILICTSLAASIFMILEAADFYARFYSGDDGQAFGLFAAILNEVFLIIMSAVWLPSVNLGNYKLLHPGNLLVKSLMIVLFLNTVGGATFNVVEEKLNELQNQKNTTALLELREQQVESAKQKLTAFIEQNQPINTAIAAKELASAQEALAKLKENTKSEFTIWFDIIVLTFLRISIQLSNITSVWIASWLYRQRSHSKDQLSTINVDLPSVENKNESGETKKNMQDATTVLPEIDIPTKLDNKKLSTLKLIYNANKEDSNNRESNAEAHKKINKVLDSASKKSNELSKQNLDRTGSEIKEVKEDSPNSLDYKSKVAQNTNYLKKEAIMLQSSISEMLAESSIDIQNLCTNLNINYSDYKYLQKKDHDWNAGDIKKLEKIRNAIKSKYYFDTSSI